MESRNRGALIIGVVSLLAVLFLCVSLALAYYVGSRLINDLSSPQVTPIVITRVIQPAQSLQPTPAPMEPTPTPVSPTTRVQPVETPTPRPTPTPIPLPTGTDYETELLVRIYEEVNPSVVYIDTESGSGSGFVWDTEGHIVTNYHVVHGAETIKVKFWDDREATASLVGEDADSDLAVVKVDPNGLDLRPVRLGDSTRVRVGERAIAIGNPFGLAWTMTVGIVSAIGRTIPAPSNYAIPEAIQTDAAVNPGNSGGPLLNGRGEVIGIVSQIRSPVRANSGVGFAVPIHIAKRVVPVLIAKGKYEHPFIGIRGTTLSPEMNEVLGLPRDLRGAYVIAVVPGYGAEKAGIRGGTRRTDYVLGYDDAGRPEYLYAGGDVIIAIEDQPVKKFDDLLIYLYRYASPGDTVTLTILREGKELKIPVTLSVRPRQ